MKKDSAGPTAIPTEAGATRVGGRPVPEILRMLGARLEEGAIDEKLRSYELIFDRCDTDHDGRHSRQEYVENGFYLDRRSREHIFGAADSDRDGFVSRGEYVLNRIITDEAKGIVGAMDRDRDGEISKNEFVGGAKIPDRDLRAMVFAALDTDGDGSIAPAEYLRVWGAWARQARSDASSRRDRQRRGPPGGFRGPPGGFRGPPGGFRGPPPFRGPLGMEGGPDVAGPRSRDPGSERLERAGWKVGSEMPDLTVHRIGGERVPLRSLLHDGYTVLVFGCLTCPAFLHSYPEIEAVHRDYAPRGVRFYYLYRALAHPENRGWVEPFTLAGRLRHIEEAKRTLGTRIPWICDMMGDDVKRAFGNLNNPQLLFGPHGKIVHMLSWSSGEELRTVLEKLVGPVEKPTSVEDLHLPEVRAFAPGSPGSLVPRVDAPASMQPLRTIPELGDTPFWVKARAEVEPSVLESGKGTMYLGFRPDPIYGVSWNNLVDPLEWEIHAPDGVDVSPRAGRGPKVAAPSDKEPREFLLRIRGRSTKEPLELTVHYFACHEKEGWCRSVTQTYEIYLERDRYAGLVLGRSFRPGGPGRGPPGSGSGGRGGPPSVAEVFERFDANGDGSLDGGEIPEGVKRFLGPADGNRDGKVTREELESFRRERGGTGRRGERRPASPE